MTMNITMRKSFFIENKSKMDEPIPFCLFLFFDESAFL
ncbi:hypothetical protein BLGI_2576 [Brevibacillus laterosporus GI-9]|nr:hypothetical protein BLGI_2576 [Brevibacillus laterosporus GI-9]